MIISANQFRYLLSALIAVIAAFFLARHFDFPNTWLVVLVTLYVMQTTIGSALYQGAKKSLQVLFIVGLAAAVLHSADFFYLSAREVLLGASVGVLANLFVWPRKADVEFRQAAANVIKVYQSYFLKTFDALTQRAPLVSNAEMENILIQLPGWVHETGFDVGLQAGYQFFLVKLEQVADVLFSLHYLARHQFDTEFLSTLEQPLEKCQQQFNKFFSAMLQVLQLKKLTTEVSEFSKDIAELEKQFYQIAPPSLELLDIQPDYIYFAELIYCLRDLHKHLVKLGEALR